MREPAARFVHGGNARSRDAPLDAVQVTAMLRTPGSDACCRQRPTFSACSWLSVRPTTVGPAPETIHCDAPHSRSASPTRISSGRSVKTASWRSFAMSPDRSLAWEAPSNLRANPSGSSRDPLPPSSASNSWKTLGVLNPSSKKTRTHQRLRVLGLHVPSFSCVIWSPRPSPRQSPPARHGARQRQAAAQWS